MPLVWYLARLEAPNIDVAGATTPGAPVVVLGHNSRIAWGFTTNSDVEDVLVEQVDPIDPRRYATPSGMAAFDAREELILAKGRASETLNVRETRHGPVISDIAANNTPLAAAHSALALQATFLSNDDQSAEPVWRLGLARD